MVMALLLLERLTPAEAAGALGMPPRELDRSFQTTLSRLRRIVRPRPVSRVPHRRAS
jgi:hypothetical protein